MPLPSPAIPACQEKRFAFKVWHQAVIPSRVIDAMYRCFGIELFPHNRTVTRYRKRGLLTSDTTVHIIRYGSFPFEYCFILPHRNGRVGALGQFKTTTLEETTMFSMFLYRFSSNWFSGPAVEEQDQGSNPGDDFPVSFWLLGFSALVSALRFLVQNPDAFREALESAEDIEEFLALAAISAS